ncbi:MAG: hypothetical protein Q8M12_03675 [bacterium]|nr:hypothetical protein [bacterium]
MSQNQKGVVMRGGKREGAGRKGFEQTKTIRIPIELEPKIIELVAKYKASLNREQKTSFESVTKSKEPINTGIPVLNDDQKKRFQIWLIKHRYAKNISEALKMTKTPELCRYTLIKYQQYANESDMVNIQDIMEIYEP